MAMTRSASTGDSSGEALAHPHASAMQLDPAQGRVGPRKVDELEDAEGAPVARVAPPARRAGRRRRRRPARPAAAPARARRRAGRKRSPRRRAGSRPPAAPGRAAGCRPGRGSRSASPPRGAPPRMRPRCGPSSPRPPPPAAARRVRSSAAITSVSEVDERRTPREVSSARSSSVFVRLPLCASATVRCGPVLDDRLRVRPVRRAGRRVAAVTDGGLPAKSAELLLGEDLRDEPHVPQNGEAAVVGDGDSRRLLAAVLEREEAEVRQARDVAVATVDADDPAHQPAPPSYATRRSASLTPSSLSPPATPSRRSCTPSSESARSGAHARTARPQPSPNHCSASLLELELGTDPGVERQLGECDREASVRDVVSSSEQRRRPPEEVDERRLRHVVGRRRASGRAAGEEHLVLRAVERELVAAGEEDDVALAPPRRAPSGRRRQRRRSRRPASAGWPARLSRYRGRRCPRRPGRRAPRRHAPFPRSPPRAPRRSRVSPDCRS